MAAGNQKVRSETFGAHGTQERDGNPKAVWSVIQLDKPCNTPFKWQGYGDAIKNAMKDRVLPIGEVNGIWLAF